jgi:hypothetical protein
MWFFELIRLLVNSMRYAWVTNNALAMVMACDMRIQGGIVSYQTIHSLAFGLRLICYIGLSHCTSKLSSWTWYEVTVISPCSYSFGIARVELRTCAHCCFESIFSRNLLRFACQLNCFLNCVGAHQRYRECAWADWWCHLYCPNWEQASVHQCELQLGRPSSSSIQAKSSSISSIAQVNLHTHTHTLIIPCIITCNDFHPMIHTLQNRNVTPYCDQLC